MTLVKAGERVLNLVSDTLFSKIPSIKLFGFNLDKARVVLDPIIRTVFVYVLSFGAQFSKRADLKAVAEAVTIANGGKTLDDVKSSEGYHKSKTASNKLFLTGVYSAINLN